ncbi:DUF3299 domain-containing protein [Defluviimonas sp. D31]|uniref:DUF3299 domain-containing protein n=1 Tax=Defluviimonas sp. D31 TaxID=3083253 RepID=UPI00296E7104|nr:DUF3299 domain-containing protein [Defluviimonas sp. D31]MDW4550711.1 DUF3299 domain-containing protein [Defluviimonas sp. D31]
MRRANILVGLALVAGLCGSIALARPMELNWDMLAPAPEPYDNPFADLSVDQMRDLRTVLKAQAAAGDNPASTLPEEAAAARARLDEQGLDVEWLFQQREIIMEKRLAASVSTVPEHVGQNVRIPGYLLPLEIQDGKATEFLLVPTVGACIHTPPPPPNQMVYVTYPQGVAVSGLYTPVWINGTLEADLRTEQVTYSDGKSNVEVSYVMQADLVEAY